MGENRAGKDGAKNALVARFQSMLEDRHCGFAVEGPRDSEVLPNLHSVPSTPTGRFADFMP